MKVFQLIITFCVLVCGSVKGDLEDVTILSEFINVIRSGSHERVIEYTREDFRGESPSKEIIAGILDDFIEGWKKEFDSIHEWTVSIGSQSGELVKVFHIRGMKKDGLSGINEPWLLKMKFEKDDRGWFFESAQSGNYHAKSSP